MKAQTKFKQTEIGMIPEDWEVESIDEVAEVVGGGTPSTKNTEYWDGDIAWITPKDLSNFKFRYIARGGRNITKKGLENSSAKLVPKGTVLLTTRAPVGYVAIAESIVSTNQGFRSLIPKDNVKSEFLFYLLKKNVEILKSNASGTTFGELSGSRLKALQFAFPDIDEQSSIAKILSDLDSKIELNQQMNKTLEAIGQTLFKRWFIDFEFPNDNGKPYKSSGGEMVDSELGEIPKGWKVGNFEEIIDITSGKRPNEKSETKNNEYSIPLIGASSVMGFVKESLYDEPIIIIGRVGTHGVVQRVLSPSFPSDNTLVIKSKYYGYSYQTLKMIDYESLNVGTTQPLITQSSIKNMKMIIPVEKLLDEYESVVSKIFIKIDDNNKENEILGLIRDSLLPKLMSGKIRVGMAK